MEVCNKEFYFKNSSKGKGQKRKIVWFHGATAPFPRIYFQFVFQFLIIFCNERTESKFLNLLQFQLMQFYSEAVDLKACH